MSRSSATLADERGHLIPPSDPLDHGGADGGAHARNGSVMAKLLGKTPPHVAVAEEVEEEEEEEEGVEEEEEEHEEDGYANGNGHGSALDDEDEDEEYEPGASDDDSGESDDDADVGDLEDEETSMRSLLLPMATYAKQLLFLNEDDDDGAFDDQDAELWGSPEDKREWIDRYEAVNRAYIDKYGCRIDAPAIPDTKKRLRQERNREAKYSLVLLALAVAYLVRLLVGPAATLPNGNALTAPIVSTLVVDVPVNTPTPQPSQEWPPDTTPWWSDWTEKLIVRVFAWPQSLLNSVESAILSTESARSNKSLDASSREDEVASAEPPSHSQTFSPIDHEEDTAPNEPPSEPIESEETASEHAFTNKDTTNEEVKEVSTSVETGVEGITDIEQNQVTDGAQAEDLAVGVNRDVPVGQAPRQSSHFPTESINSVSVDDANEVAESRGADTENPTASEEIRDTHEIHLEESTINVEVASHDRAADESFQRCLDMFHTLVKMKHDDSVKSAAVSECDRAVEDASYLASMKLIRAQILRGDLKSLLQLFADANQDYEATLNSGSVESTLLQSEIEIKIASNRWIEFYHTKNYKELRSDCQRVYGSASTAFTPGTPDRVRELAGEWLRAFRKETTVLAVLTKTRAWTLYRPVTPQMKTN